MLAVTINCYLIKYQAKQKHLLPFNYLKLYINNINHEGVINSDIDIKKHTYYFFNDIMKLKKIDPNKIKIDEKSYTNIIICYIGYVAIKYFKHIKINSVKLLYSLPAK